MGGGSYGKLFDSVECFDPKTQQWTGLCPLKERRYLQTALVFLGFTLTSLLSSYCVCSQSVHALFHHRKLFLLNFTYITLVTLTSH